MGQAHVENNHKITHVFSYSNERSGLDRHKDHKVIEL